MPIYLGKDLVNNSIIGNQIVSEIQSGRRLLNCRELTIVRVGTGSRTFNWKDCYSGKPQSFTWNNAQTYRFVVSDYTDPGGVTISVVGPSAYNPSWPTDQFPTPCNCQNITVTANPNGYLSYVPCNGSTATFIFGTEANAGIDVTGCFISGSIAVAASATPIVTINSDCSTC